MTMPRVNHRHAAALASVLLVLVTACGGDSSDSAPEESEQADYSTVEEVAAAAGCTEYTPADEPMLFASETGDCDAPRPVGQITINMFNNNDARDKYVDVGTSNGAVYVVGDGWLVECETRKQQTAVQALVGGELEG